MSDPSNAQLAAARVYMRGAAAEIEALPQFEKHVQQLEDKFKALKDLGDKKDAIAFFLRFNTCLWELVRRYVP